MSQENVELARQYYEALNRGGMDASERFRHPDIEIFDSPDFPDAGRHVGEAAVRKKIDDYREMGWDGQLQVEEVLDAGEEVVVLWQARILTRHAGGLPMEVMFGDVLLFEEGKVRRIRQYSSKAEALEAAGLRK